ncbi:MAG: glucoamylase family protein [Pirellulaceae bacterium]|nr:glucoamylase family protein [Pirellulaceae bacterium]
MRDIRLFFARDESRQRICDRQDSSELAVEYCRHGLGVRLLPGKCGTRIHDAPGSGGTYARNAAFFWNSPQGLEPDATGYHGFYYHFLDMQTGRRAWHCELSTVDSAFLLAEALTAAFYFGEATADEHGIRSLAGAHYRRADWQLARNGGATVTHGWKPDNGFLKYRWEGYDEALLLYILGLGSPTHPLPEEGYAAKASTYEWEHYYGQEYLYARPRSRIRYHTSGSTFVVFRMLLCGIKASTISRTAAA